MKRLLLLSFLLVFGRILFAQCIWESYSQLPIDCQQGSINYKYMGTSGKENKSYTEIMWNKMVDMHSLFDAAFKNTKGVTGLWTARVDDISNEGLVTGTLQISLHPVTCKNGEIYKGGNSTLDIYVYINSFDPNIVKDKKKASGFIDDDSKDYVDDRRLYVIAKEQEEEPFKGFPTYIRDWNSSTRESSVIISKPGIPLFKSITINDFLGFFRNWTASYNAKRTSSTYNATPEKIDKFISSNAASFFTQPCITTWDRSEQLPYVKRTSYVSDVTMGNPWVTIHPDYMKGASVTSIQFVTVRWRYEIYNKLTLNALRDFKNNFDFKKLQSMLGR